MSNGNDMLMSGGRPWASFPEVGATVTGTVSEAPLARQSRDFDTGKPAFWDDDPAQPMMEVVVILQTELRDPEVDGDDGTRQLVLGKGSHRFRAVQTAVRRAGAKGLEVGGKLTVTCSGEEPPKRRNAKPTKLYSAVYEAPLAKEEPAPVSEAEALSALAGLVKSS